MTVYTIANAAQLTAALSAARGGETFRLQSGDYGNVRIGNLASGLTIEAAPGATVQFDRLAMWNTDNLVIRNVAIGSGRAPGEPVWTRSGEFWGSQNLTLDRVKVHGSLDGNPQNDGWGLLIRDMDGVTIRNSEFTELSRGLMFERAENLIVANNRFHKLEMDGTNFASVRNVLIDGNSFSDFRPLPGAHPDAIQFWTANQKTANTDIVIRNNVMLQGAGVGPQGILLGEENGNLPYRNVTIENNLMYGADHWHGIAVYHAHGLKIASNTIVSPTGDAERFWIFLNRTHNAVVTKNVTDQLLLKDNVGLQLSDNIDLHADRGKLALLPDLNAGAGATIADLLVPGYGYKPPLALPPIVSPPAPTPQPTPEPTPPGTGPLFGTAGSDTLYGTAGNDRIYGIGQSDKAAGRGSVDQLWGRGGADIFVLGDHRGIFYDDGRGGTSGRGDFARINDFAKGDRLQLAGERSDYLFRASKLGGTLEIFSDSNGDGRWDSGDELIAQLANVKDLTPDTFIFA